MSRSLELGRAVLDTPTTNHELWLTTLITILPEQNASHLAQLTPVQCLETLASGGLWVHRGNDMHLDLRFTLHNEALPPKQLQDLTNAVLQAPIWDILMLRPSLPSNAILDPGTVRLNVSHATVNKRETEQKRHRLFPDVPAADIRPPDTVMSVALQSVHLSIDILETSPRRKLMAKRPNPYPSEHGAPTSQTDNPAINLFDMNSQGPLDGDASKPIALASSRKRKRPITGMPPRHLEPSDRAFTLNESGVQAGPGSELRHGLVILPSLVDIRTMVDSALRLSIRGTMNKFPNGFKVKASTFRLGLADVAPALWRHGYLDALSHRAHLMPTIAQSLAQMGFVRATSVSLRSKMESIGNATHVCLPDEAHGLGLKTGPCSTHVRSSISSRLWVRSQKILLQGAVPLTQACVGSHQHEVDSDSDEMLAEENECINSRCRAKDESDVPVSSSETIDDGYALPATPPAVTSDDYPGRVYYPPSGGFFLGNDFPELEEEQLFDLLP